MSRLSILKEMNCPSEGTSYYYMQDPFISRLKSPSKLVCLESEKGISTGQGGIFPFHMSDVVANHKQMRHTTKRQQRRDKNADLS
jgi:hypothetical protein